MTADAVSLLDLREAREGVILRLRCRPGRARTSAVGVHDGAVRLDVGAAPEKGRANREVLSWLARALGVDRDRLRVTAGETTRDKSVLITGLDPGMLRARLAAHIP